MVLLLAGCTAPWMQPPIGQDKELKELVDAYQQQNADAAARRRAVADTRIRRLEVIRGQGSHPLVTADLEQASLSIVVGRILQDAGVPYAVEPGLLRGSVTSNLNRVALLPALNALLSSQSLVAVLRDGVVVIKDADFEEANSQPAPPAAAATAKPPDKRIEDKAASKPAAEKSDPAKPAAEPQPIRQVITREVPLTHMDAAMATAFLEALAKKAPTDTDAGVRFSFQPYTNTVFLTGAPQGVAHAVRALRSADRDPAHVAIEVLVVALNSDAEEELGVDLKTLARSGTQFITKFGSLTDPAFTYASGVKGPSGVRAEINLLVSQNKARIIARPYLATTSGRKAKIEITKEQYIIVQQASGGATITGPQSVSTGVKLEILPQVAADGKIRMDVTVEQSQFVNPDNDNISTEVSRNTAQTTMEVDNGQAILIGGMSQHLSVNINSGLPWLRHVPILNIFFAKYEGDSVRQQVLVYVTPYILSEPDLSFPIAAPNALGPQSVKGVLSPVEGGEE
jgi:type II secretory pathway component GspD/PulD (secretin)